MRKILTTVALVLALSLTAFAGEMHAPVVAPPQSTALEDVTIQGIMHTPVLVEITLGLLALF